MRVVIDKAVGSVVEDDDEARPRNRGWTAVRELSEDNIGAYHADGKIGGKTTAARANTNAKQQQTDRIQTSWRWHNGDGGSAGGYIRVSTLQRFRASVYVGIVELKAGQQFTSVTHSPIPSRTPGEPSHNPTKALV